MKHIELMFDSHLTLKNLTHDEVEEIKKRLTFTNPQYAKVKQYSKYNTTKIPPYLYYYQELAIDKVRVPVGFDFNFIPSERFPHPVDLQDIRVYPTVKYPVFKMVLRENQLKAVNAYMTQNVYNNTCKITGSIQMNTGMGKSVLGLYIASALSVKTLIVGHKDDLVKGWQKDIELAFGGKLTPGLIKAQSKIVGEQITIATVQTLSRMNTTDIENLYNQFGLVIQDECLVGDTLVLKADGGVKQIKDVVNYDCVYGGDVSNQFSRQAQIYRLNFNHGFIEGSYTHKTFCIDKRKYINKHTTNSDFSNAKFEVKCLGDLDSNYVVPVLRKIPHIERNKGYSPEFAYAAVIMCDGHLDKGKNKRVKVNISKDREFYREVHNKFLSNTWELKESIDVRGNLTLWTNDDDLKDLLKDKWNIPCGKKSDKIVVPEFVYYSPLECIKTFIEACYSCEGDLSQCEGGWRINFATCSKQFAVGLSYLMRKFGIVCNFQIISHEKGYNTSYRLTCGGEMFNQFMDTFNLIPRKMTSERNSGSKNKNRIFGEYYLSDIKTVEYLGYKDTVYDFEVSDSHSFIANGILTHNCHHVPSNTFLVTSEFNSRYKIGLTATPERKDGLAHVMNLYFGGFCYQHTYTKKDEDILPVTVNIRELNLFFNPVCKCVTQYGRVKYEIDNLFAPKDFPIDEHSGNLIRLSDIPYEDRPKVPYHTIDNFVVNECMQYFIDDVLNEYNQGHSCLVFFTQKEHCRLFRDKLWALGDYSCSLYYGDNSDNTNEAILELAKDKRKWITVTTYAKSTEGTNCPQWEVAFLCSSMNDGKNTEQAIGRIRRSISDGDKINPVKVYDYRYKGVYSFYSHGRTRDERYDKLGFDVTGRTQNVFRKGYN